MIIDHLLILQMIDGDEAVQWSLIARCAQVTMIKRVDAGVVDICTYNHLDLCLSNSFVFTGLFAFFCLHLLAFVVADYTCLHIVITWSLFFPNCCSWSFFFELLLYHITALTVLFSFFCFSLCKLFYQMTFFCKWSFKLSALTLLFAFLFVVLQFILPYHFFLQNILSD